MKYTVLIDLDGTLLVNDVNVFVSQYLVLLSNFLADIAPPNQVIKLIMSASQAMVSKRDPQHTLEETFDDLFYPPIGQTKNQLRNRLEYFYDSVFPELEAITNRQPGAIDLIEYLLENNHQIIIATNPLFPSKAIHQRLSWAGLPVEKYPFQLVTSYEYFHFAKPNPEYFAEILGQTGWQNNPVLMIGNSLPDDILPADSMGIPTYWINNDDSCKSNGLHQSACSGKISGVINWLEGLSSIQSDDQFNSPKAIRAIIAATPSAIDTILSKFLSRGGNISGEYSAEICDLLEKLISSIDSSTPTLPSKIRDHCLNINKQFSNNQNIFELNTFRTEFMNRRSALLSLFDKLYGVKSENGLEISYHNSSENLDIFNKIAREDKIHVQKLVNLINSMPL